MKSRRQKRSGRGVQQGWARWARRWAGRSAPERSRLAMEALEDRRMLAWNLASADTSGSVGQYTSMVEVDGLPAIGYLDTVGNVNYARATDAAGSNWNSVVAYHFDNPFFYPSAISLQLIGGLPAISFLDVEENHGYVSYVRATDAAGSAWTAATVDSTVFAGDSSLHEVGGLPAISYYDFDNGDLKYARATDVAGSSWTAVSVDSTADDVGMYSSLQVVDGKPAIAYYDLTNGDLKYARAADAAGSSWTVVTVDTGGEVGTFASLGVVGGLPAISYYDFTNGDLKYARAADAAGSSWTVTAVDTAGNVGSHGSLQVVGGLPAISYYDEDRGHLKYARADETAGTNWSAETVDSDPSVGLYTSLQVVDGRPAISYYDSTNGFLKYARDGRPSDPAWGIASADPTGNAGAYASLQELGGLPAISYYDSTNGDLKFAWAGDVAGTSWTVTSVDTLGDVGWYTSLQIIGGVPGISYYDLSNGDLKYAKATDTTGTTWTRVSVDTTGNVGLYSSLQVVGGLPAISYWDATHTTLKYALATDATATAWTTVTVDSAAMAGAYCSLQVVGGRPAISYYDGTAKDLKYARANDATGITTWAIKTVDSAGDVGQDTSLQVVGGLPAISYYDAGNGNLKYARATDVAGSSWSINPVDTVGDVGRLSSMQVVDGLPSISYIDEEHDYLKYARASSVSGAIWTTTALDSTADSWTFNSNTSLQVIGGLPAIAYQDATFGDLKYARLLTSTPRDFGDAPTAAQSGFASSYPTLLAADGARHAAAGPQLGALRDTETDGQPNAAALGDDATGSADEDGVKLLAPLVASATSSTIAAVLVQLQSADLASNKIDAWIDFNRDGDWSDPGEQTAAALQLGTTDGLYVLPFTIPAGASPGTTYARVRLSTAGGLTPTGTAADGEVEDYPLTIVDGSTPQSVSVTMSGTGNYALSLSGSNLVIKQGATVVFQVPAASIQQLTVEGTAADETLTVDFSGGNPLPADGIAFHGGAGLDAIYLQKGSSSGLVQSVTHTFVNANDGSVSLDADGAGPAAARTISYTSLDPIYDDLDAVDRTFTFTGANETIQLQDAIGAFNTIDSDLGESVTFANPSGSLTINSTVGTDTVKLSSIDSNGPFQAAFNVNAGTASTVRFDAAAVNIGAAAATITAGNIAFPSGSIRTTGNVSLTANGTTGSITTNASGADVVAATATIRAGSGGVGTPTTLLRTWVTNLDVAATGTGSISIIEVDSVHLNAVNTAANFTLQTTGAITNAVGATLTVGGTATLTASGATNSITLGADASDTVNFAKLTFSGGVVYVNLDSAVQLTGTNTATSGLTLRASGAITDAASTQIAVTSTATFNAGTNSITLGDSAGDVTNFTSLNLTGGAVAVSEDSATQLTGVAAASLTLNSSGDLTDADGTTLAISGLATFHAGANNILLGDNAFDATDFGSLAVTGNSVTITESSATVFNYVSATTLTLTANGSITDADGTTITVSGLAGLTAISSQNITLGDYSSDITHFGQLNVTGGTVAITEDSDTVLTGVSATGLTLASSGPISDAPGTSLSVSGTADFNAGLNSVVLGDSNAPADTTNFGSLRLSAGGVIITEDSSTQFTGSSSVDSLTLTSAGTITDATGTTLNVTGLAMLTATAGSRAIQLGDQASDVTNLGSLTFSGAAVTLTLDSPVQLTGTNAATSLTLRASGAISDSNGTTIAVSGLALLDAGLTSIVLGDSNAPADTTNFGSLQLTGGGAVTIAEDSDTVLTGPSSVDSLTLSSAGTITDADGTQLIVAGLAFLDAGSNAITLGDAAGDNVQFPTLTVKGGAVAIALSAAVALTGTSTATSLTLQANGAISDTNGTTIAVSGAAWFNAGTSSIVLGDSAAPADTTNFDSLRLTGGAVTVSEDSGTELTGVNAVASLTLTSNGPITDADGAQLSVTGQAAFDAGVSNIVLGDAASDQTDFGTLRATGATITIGEDSSSSLAGVSAASFTLTANGPITDVPGTALEISGQGAFVAFDGTATYYDVTLGDDAADATHFGSVRLTGAAVAFTEDSSTLFSGGTLAATLAATSAGAIDVNGKITASGSVTLVAADNITVNVAIDPATVVLESDDDIEVNAAVTATDSITVTAGKDGSGGAILSTSGSLTATGAGSSVAIATGATGGDVTLDGDVSAVGRLTLLSYGAVSQTAGTAAAAELLLLGGAAVAMDQTTNDFDTVAADLNAGSVTITDADELTVGTVGAIHGIATGASADGGRVALHAWGLLSVNQPIDTTGGTGGVLMVGSGVTIFAALALGAGNIELGGGAAAEDLTIATDLSLAGSVYLSAVRDIIIGANLTTTDGGEIQLTADSDDSGSGGVLVDAPNGQVHAAGDLRISGSSLIFGGLGHQIQVEDGTAAAELTAGGTLTLTHGIAEIAAADIVLDGQLQGTTLLAVMAYHSIAIGNDASLTATSAAMLDAANGSINGAGAITADTIQLSAAEGIGDVTTLNLAASTLSADAGNGSIGLNNAAAAPVTVTSLTTGGEWAGIQFAQTGGQTLSVTLAQAGIANIVITNADAALTAAVIATGGAETGDIVLETTGSGDIYVGALNAARLVEVRSAGRVEEAGADADPDVAAPLINLRATAGIGSLDTLEISGETIAAETTDGNVDLDNVATAPVTLQLLASGTAEGTGAGNVQFDQTGGQTLSVTTAWTVAGNVTISNTGADLAVAEATAGGEGNILLATAESGDVLLGSLTAAGNLVSITAAGAIAESGEGDAAADVSAADLALRAVGGIGSGNALETAISRLAFSCTTSQGVQIANTGSFAVDAVDGLVASGVEGEGSITLAAEDATSTADLSINANVATTGGGIDLYAARSINFATTTWVHAAGTVEVLAGTNYHDGTPTNGGDGSVVMASDATTPSGGWIQSDSGNIVVRAPRHVLVCRLDARLGDILVTADDAGVDGGMSDNVGGIVDNSNSEATNLIAQRAALRAGSGVGNYASSGKDIDMDVATLAILTESGYIDVQDVSGGLEIGTVDGLAGVTLLDALNKNAGRHITFRVNGGPLTISAPVVDRDAGSIQLAVEGSTTNIDLTVNANVTAQDGKGNVLLYTGDSLSIGNGATISAATTGAVFAFGGIDYNHGSYRNGTATGELTMADGTAILSASGNIKLRAPGDVKLATVNADSDADGHPGNVYIIADYAGPVGGLSDNVGAILDSSVGETANITGYKLSLRSGSGIGDGVAGNSDDLDVAVVYAVATTESGDINIEDLGGGLTIDTFDSLAGVTIRDALNDNSALDQITLRTNSLLSVTANDPIVNNDGGGITLAAEGNKAANDLTINSSVTAAGGSGAISLYAGDTLDLASTITDVATTITVGAAGTGAVVAMAGTNYHAGAPANGLKTGDVVMGSRARIHSAAGNITLKAPGNVVLNIVNADSDAAGAQGNVVVTADFAGPAGGLADLSGAISDGYSGESLNIVGGQLALRAASGLGAGVDTDVADLDVSVATLAASTDTGMISIQNTAAGLTIGTVDGLSGVTILDSANDNSHAEHITLRSQPLVATTPCPLTVASGVSITNSDGGNVTLWAGETTGAGDNVTLDENAVVLTIGGNIEFRAGDQLVLASNSHLVTTGNPAATVKAFVGYSDKDGSGGGYLGGTIDAPTQVQVWGGTSADALTIDLGTAILPAGLGLKFDGAGNTIGQDSLVVLGQDVAEAYCIQDSTAAGTWSGNNGRLLHTTSIVAWDSPTEAPTSDAILDYAHLETMEVDTLDGTDDVTFGLTATTPFVFKLHGGAAEGDETDRLRIVGSGAADEIAVGDFDASGNVAVNYYQLDTGNYVRTATKSVAQGFRIRGVKDLQVYGLGGADTLINNTSLAAMLSGGDGDDLLFGNAARDVIFGGQGKDQLLGEGGDDYLLADTDYVLQADHNAPATGPVVQLTPAQASADEILDGSDGTDDAVAYLATDHVFNAERTVADPATLADEALLQDVADLFPKCPVLGGAAS